MTRRAASWHDWNHWNDGLGQTVWQESAPSHSRLLGPDGRPLQYQRPRLGFDLRPKAERERDEG